MERQIGTRFGIWALLVALLAGAGFRALHAERNSLWLDELHTTEIARAADAAGVVDALRPDFHAPLHFLFCHLLQTTPPHQLRLLSDLIGLLALIPLLLLLADARAGRAARWALIAGLLLLPFQIRHGTELRPYAWLQMWVAWALWASFSPRGPRGLRFGVFALATALGLYTHYTMALAVLGIGGIRLLWPRRGALGLGPLIAAGALGALLFLPWVVEVEGWIFEDPSVMVRDEKQDAPGEARAPVDRRPPLPVNALATTPLRMMAPTIDRLGPTAPLMMVGLGLLALGLAFALLAPRRESPPPSRETALAIPGGALAACAMITALTGTACALLWGRVPIQYFALASAGWPLLFALLGERAERRGRAAAFVAITGLGLLLMAGAQAFGDSREEIRGGMAELRDLLAEGAETACTAVMRQPDHYDHLEVFRVYGEGLSPVAAEDLAPPPEGGPGRVLVLTRSAPPEHPEAPTAWARLLEGRRVVAKKIVDRAIVLYTLDAR